MKISVVLTVDLDPDEWAREYGVERAEVRDDVREHVQRALYDHFGPDGLDVVRDVTLPGQ